VATPPPAPPPTKTPPAPPLRRTLAKAVDFALAIGVAALAYQATPWGALIAAPLILLSDALPGGSLGKRLMGLRVVPRRSESLRPVLSSILRNIPLALVTPLAMLPFFWLLLLLLLPVFLSLEGALALLHPEGLRLGDRLADTRVIEDDPDDDGGASDKYMTRPDL
jgi:uncharacterized RDD family membrane protein YckC